MIFYVRDLTVRGLPLVIAHVLRDMVEDAMVISPKPESWTLRYIHA